MKVRRLGKQLNFNYPRMEGWDRIWQTPLTNRVLRSDPHLRIEPGAILTPLTWTDCYSALRYCTLTCLELDLNNFLTTSRQKSESWSLSWTYSWHTEFIYSMVHGRMIRDGWGVGFESFLGGGSTVLACQKKEGRLICISLIFIRLQIFTLKQQCRWHLFYN